MNPSNIARIAAQRTPLISFIGKRTIPQHIDHTPRPHPQAPTGQLPKSFAEYRQHALQHGPLAVKRQTIEPKTGEYFDRNELPQRFWRSKFSQYEIELIESGGAAAFA